MLEKEWIIRGIPDWVLREYLEKLGGQENPDGGFSGNGWQANITRLADEPRHSLVFQCYRVVINGDPGTVSQVWKGFELRILRPGG